LIIAAVVLAEATVIASFVLLLAAKIAGVPGIARPMGPLDYVDAVVSSFAATERGNLDIGEAMASNVAGVEW
jgi:hypothetical protein